MNTPTTPPNIERLKREAKARSKTGELTHSQCLEVLARQHGFRTYAALLAAQKAPHDSTSSTGVTP